MIHKALLPTLFASSVSCTCPIDASSTVVVLRVDDQVVDWQPQTGYVIRYGAYAAVSQWESSFWSWWSARDPRVAAQSVDVYEFRDSCDVDSLALVKALVVPGGDSYTLQALLGATGKANILAFLASGGLYVGTCAGFFYAARSYVWQGVRYDWASLLGAFDVQLEGSIKTLQDYDVPPYAAMRKVTLTAAEAGDDGDRTQTLPLLYFGGPTWGLSADSADATALPIDGSAVLAIYNESGAVGLPAIVRVRAEGRHMLLFSPHLEAVSGIGYAAGIVNDVQHQAAAELRSRLIQAELDYRAAPVAEPDHRAAQVSPPTPSRTLEGGALSRGSHGLLAHLCVVALLF